MSTPEHNNLFPEPGPRLQREHEKARIIGAIGYEIEQLLDDGYDQIEMVDSTIERQKGTYIMDGVWQVLKRQRCYSAESTDDELSRTQLITTGYVLAKSSRPLENRDSSDEPPAEQLSRISIPRYGTAIVARTESGGRLLVIDSRGMTSVLDAIVFGGRTRIPAEPEDFQPPTASNSILTLGWLRRLLGRGEAK